MSSTPISTVEVGGFKVSSNFSDGETMKASLTSPKEDSAEPRVVMDEGRPVGDEEEAKAKLSEAASELGKKGGEAAAAKRAEEKEASETEEKVKEKKGNPRHDPQARVHEATREAKEAREAAQSERERREALERRLADLERRVTPEPQKAKPSDDSEPKEDDFDSYADFVKASARWGARQEFKERQAEASQNAERRERDQSLHSLKSEFAKSMAEVRKTDPQFIEKIAPQVLDLEPTFELFERGGANPTARNWIADEFVLSPEDAPLWMLHLTEHPDDLQRIAALSSPRAVTRELAKIAKSLPAVTAGTSAKQEVSKAKPPVRPVTGAPHIADDGSYKPGMSLDEYAPIWSKATKAKR